MWLKALNRMKKTKKLTVDEISSMSNIPKGTLNKLFAGQTKDPQLSTVYAVVHCMGYTLDDLYNETNMNNNDDNNFEEIIEKYRTLDEHGIDMVDTVLEKEYTRVIAQQEKDQPKEEKPKVYRIPVAARGGGVSYVEQTQEEYDKAEKLIREKYPELLGKSNID